MAPTDMDLRILRDLAIHGDNVPANICDNIDGAKKYVNRRLRRLEENDYVSNKGRGVYQLTDKGREALSAESDD
jgi:predicted transcriptional regulator